MAALGELLLPLAWGQFGKGDHLVRTKECAVDEYPLLEPEFAAARSKWCPSACSLALAGG